MTVVEAPQEYHPGPQPALFLAGGISGCPGWQAELIALMEGLPLTVLNPRRANFPINDPEAAEGQVGWEFRHLRSADAVLFWFPAETLCPITLYELGTWSAFRDDRGPRPLFVGTHPDYGRRHDVVIQTRFARPEVTVRCQLEELADDVQGWLRSAGTACPIPAG
jgi:hypothetical protein